MCCMNGRGYVKVRQSKGRSVSIQAQHRVRFQQHHEHPREHPGYREGPGCGAHGVRHGLRGRCPRSVSVVEASDG